MYLLWFHSMFGLASWMSVFYTDVITGEAAQLYCSSPACNLREKCSWAKHLIM